MRVVPIAGLGSGRVIVVHRHRCALDWLGFLDVQSFE